MKVPVDDLDKAEEDEYVDRQVKKYLWTQERYREPDVDVSNGGEPIPGSVYKLAVESAAYKSLFYILEEAFARAAYGKGKERHARGDEEFEDQFIIRGAETFGIGGHYFQMAKKLEESFNMSGEQRINELLDIIVYAAAAIMVTRGVGGCREESVED